MPINIADQPTGYFGHNRGALELFVIHKQHFPPVPVLSQKLYDLSYFAQFWQIGNKSEDPFPGLHRIPAALLLAAVLNSTYQNFHFAGCTLTNLI